MSGRFEAQIRRHVAMAMDASLRFLEGERFTEEPTVIKKVVDPGTNERGPRGADRLWLFGHPMNMASQGAHGMQTVHFWTIQE